MRYGRAAAWDGREDPDTGEGGNVWVGTCAKLEVSGTKDYAFKLDGDTGAIVQTIDFSNGCLYGAAMYGDSVWFVDRKYNKIYQVNTDTYVRTNYTPPNVGTADGLYGFTMSPDGMAWTGSYSHQRVYRYSPGTPGITTLSVKLGGNTRGIAVGSRKSAGYVWVADSSQGRLFKIDETSLSSVGYAALGVGLVGVAIDMEGFVWTVSTGTNDTTDIGAAYKVNPATLTSVKVTIGKRPYTYSDMTGVQLRSVIPDSRHQRPKK
jgi:streptogramin lyase